MFTVEDTGIGISETDIKKLFKPYEKLTNNTSLKINPKGIGLGLIICDSLIKVLKDDKNAELTIRS